jgi:Raf kinase inhibitor-like YbhB/YbcL family protein
MIVSLRPCSGSFGVAQLPPVPELVVRSASLTDGEPLPRTHWFDGLGVGGDNRSPQLSWSGHPAATRSFAVTCFDPDARTGSGFWHWVLVDIPAEVVQLAEGAGSGEPDACPRGAFHVRNDFGAHCFGGAAPRPAQGTHHYVFAVHALDRETVGVAQDATPAMVGARIGAFSLARGYLVSTLGGR